MRYLYCIAPVDGFPIKIGLSRRPFERLTHCDGWSPAPLRPLAFAECGWSSERNVHLAFAFDRLRSEWFARSPRLERFLSALRAGAAANRLRIDDPWAERWTAKTGEEWRAAPREALVQAIEAAKQSVQRAAP